jgi:anti-sigma-K factor RskA
MTHDQLRELSGGYALGALDEAERRAFEAHLPTCPECAAEVRELGAVAAALALGVPQVDPPAALRDRVLRATTAAQPAPSIVAKAEGGTHEKGLPPERRQAFLAMLSAAAVLVALALGVYAASLLGRIGVLEQQLRVAADRDARSRQQLVQLRAASESSAQVRRILAADDLRRVDLAGTKAAPAASGRAFWSRTQGLVVAFANLPPTDAGRIYQLWVIPPGGTPIGAGLLEPQADGRALALATPGTSDRVATVAVTLEKAGGSPTPQGAMIAAGTLAN